MIINWYSAIIDPGRLSRRLRTAYVLWLSLGVLDELPSLEQIRSSDHYRDLEPYMAIAEGRGDTDIRDTVFSAAGPKVVELFGMDITARRLDKILTESGQTLAEETFTAMRDEGKPIHLSIAGSPIVSHDIEVIQMPLRHDDKAMHVTMLVYDF